MASETNETREKSLNFLEEIIEESIAGGETRIQTRFPPEPNGYLHIGHAKSICINFGLAKKYGGKCNLRFDDTNPVKEDVEYVDSIKRDIQWLGFDWAVERYASDYFDQLYDWAIVLIKKGLAYVDDQTQEQIRENRGTVSVPGTPSPWRDRSVEENLDLFVRMKNGEFPDGAKVLRAKIDMASPNVVMRDPTLYRIRHAEHHRTGDKWCVYPMYDFTHCLSDSLEGITHSICTLEFVNNRELYDWVLDALNVYHPQQIEFARLGLTYTVLSKRKLIQLVKGGFVRGWDDPRMPTLCGLRRRGYTPRSIRNFSERNGVSKAASTVEYGFLEYCLREDLNETARRVMAVLRPIKLTITNYPEGQSETVTVENNPNRPEDGVRAVTFSRNLYIEAEDFLETPVPKYKRLYPDGPECRLKGAYLIRCTGCVKDASGAVTEILCEYDPDSRGGDPADGRKVKGATIHWVNAADAVDAEVRLYDNLFTVANPDEGNFRWGVTISQSYFPKDNTRFFQDFDGTLIEWLSQFSHDTTETYLRGFLGRMLFSGDDVYKPVKVLSGGERRRVALCRLLLQQPDVLLLDEPTNHLDAESIDWLEQHLQQYKGTVIAVTHDRYFLDNVAGWILELDRGEGIPWKGNYSGWLDQKTTRMAMEEKQESKRRKTLERELEWVRMSPSGRHAKSKARLSAYDKMMNEDTKQKEEKLEIFIPNGPRLGDVVIEAHDVSKAFGDRVLYEGLDFSLPPAGIVGVIGANGTGKTTLFRMIMGLETPTGGSFRVGPTVKLAYVDQQHKSIDPEKTVFEVISGGLDLMTLGNRQVNARAYVARFNFSGADQEKKCGMLSGGERNRLHLALALKEEGNVLLLDEPTNDIDVNTLRALEEGLDSFAGCAVVISHDRWFLDRICTHILSFEGDSNVVFYEGTYSEYEEYKRKQGGDTEPKRVRYRKLIVD